MPFPAAHAQELSAAEKIYAELAKLPPEERHQRIVDGAKKEGQFHFIHSLRGTLGRNHLALFRKRYPFINVDMTELGSQDAAERMVVEESTDNHLTDIAIANTPDLIEPIAKNIVARFPTPETRRVLKQYEAFLDPQNRWVPLSIDEHGIVYNSNLIKEPPKAYEDLCQSSYKGQISFEPLEIRFLAGMLEIFGRSYDRLDNWLSCIAKNKPIIQRGHTQRQTLMVAGDHAISPDQYIYAGLLLKKKNPSVPFGVDYETPISITALNVIINRNAPHPYAAALFADWSVSEESQEYLAKEYRGPSALKHPYFPDTAKLVPYGFISAEDSDKLQALWMKHIGSK
jgi:iron(III) transport system substrate-binding protein